MLGCHDFCGYYEWTFHYLRRRFGEAALEKYWTEAIAADSQRHYIASAQSKGLQGLYESWSKTGVDEHCDWSVILDEERNLVRLDMRECPSKGFLLDNNLNADEDYCDHCMGWINPALAKAGFEVAAHEHNHCGQCWWEVRGVRADQPTVEVDADIRKDPRWEHGYLHRFEHGARLPLIENSTFSDPCDVLIDRFRSADSLVVLGPETPGGNSLPEEGSSTFVVMSGRSYAAGDYASARIGGVLLEHDANILPAVSRRYHASEDRPLLMHAYLPHQPLLDFAAHKLPRAVPILPLLIRTGVYTHDAVAAPPDMDAFGSMLAVAFTKLERK